MSPTTQVHLEVGQLHRDGGDTPRIVGDGALVAFGEGGAGGQPDRDFPQRRPPSASPTMQDSIRHVLASLGEDPEREGLQDTPQRVARALTFLTQGYTQDADVLLNNALFTVEYDEMVVIKDIEIFSMCEHHMLPFYGKAHVAYLPRGKVVGLSKIPRLVDMFARRLQVQERLTTEIAAKLDSVLAPRGVAVVVEAVHFCMMMRGVQKQNPLTMTSCMLGEFREQRTTRDEFLSVIRNQG
jgi:GTP cyclohydrolase I